MQKFRQKALPLVSVGDKQNYILGTEALEMIKSLNGKISVISVAGLYRTGKSYLLNRMLLNRSDGFGVGSTIEACTKGIWIWGKPLIQKIGDEVVNVLVVDSEGLGSLSQDSNHDAKIFALTLLISSVFIYNSVGSIDENTLAGLGLIINISKHLKVKTNSEQISQVDQFPHLFWVIRDFSLQLVDKSGHQITQKQYLENSLAVQSGASDTDGRNEVRKAILKYFKDRDCITLVRPTANEGELQHLNKMDLDSLKPEFVEQVLNFRKCVMSSLTPKTLYGRYLNGITFCEMVSSFVESVNKGGVPTIQTTWKYICQQQSLRAFEQCMEQFDYEIHEQIKRKIPMAKTNFKKTSTQIKVKISNLFKTMVGQNLESQQYFKQLGQRMDSKIELLKSDNRIQNVKAAQQFVSSEFESIQKKIRSGQYKKIGQLIKQMQLFQQYYKKKCPYQQGRAQLAITQFLLRKLCQGVISISKQSNQQDAEVLKAKGKEMQQKFQQQLDELKGKMAKQRMQLLQKSTTLEKTKEQQQSRIDILNQQIEKYKTNLQEIIKEKDIIQTSQRRENTKCINDLRIINGQLEMSLQECKVDKNQRLSVLDKQILLLKNRVEYFQKNNQQLTTKIKQNDSSHKQFKQQQQKTIKQLENKYETNKNALNCKIRNLDSLLEQRINQLAMSEAQKCVLESRIQDLEQRNKSLKDHSEFSLRQAKQQFAQQKQNQIQKLHKQLNNSSSELVSKIKKLEMENTEKQSLNKQMKLQFEKMMALLSQKVQFLQTESDEKEQTISKQNSEYLQLMLIVQSKNNEISQLQEQLRMNDEEADKESMEVKHQLAFAKDSLAAKNLQVLELGQQIQTLNQHIKSTSSQNATYKQEVTKLSEQVKSLDTLRKQTVVQQEIRLQREIKKLNAEHQIQKEQEKQRTDQLLKNNERTLIQLKNFYQMQKERNEKKLLEETQKVNILENETIYYLKNQYNRLQKSSEAEMLRLTQQLSEVSVKLKDSEERFQKSAMKNQTSFEQQLLQKSLIISQFQKKDGIHRQQLKKRQKQFEEQKLVFFRKVENITFEMSRKQKEILQLTSKKESAEQNIIKKDQLLAQLKRQYQQEIKLANDKIDELKTKLQILKDEHIQLKIESDKQIALAKQSNQFLTNKLSDMIKERQLLSSKNLSDKPQVQKTQLIREQYEKAQQQISSLQSKLQKARKATREAESNLSKHMNQVQKQKLMIQQKLVASEDKVKQLNSRLMSKIQQYQRQIEQLRQRLSLDKSSLTSDYDKMKDDFVKKNNLITELQSKLQRQTSLLEQKIRFIQNQKQQLKKELEESRRKLEFMMGQLQKGRKPEQQQERRQNQNQKKLNAQLQVLKETLKRKSDETEETQQKYKTESKQLRDKINELQDKLMKNQKQYKINELLIQENQKLKKERDHSSETHRIQMSRETEQNRKKVNELQKKNKNVQKKIAQQVFAHEKQRVKWMSDRDLLNDKIADLQGRLKDKDLNSSTLMDKKSPDKYKYFSANYQMMKSMPSFDRKL